MPEGFLAGSTDSNFSNFSIVKIFFEKNEKTSLQTEKDVI